MGMEKECWAKVGGKSVTGKALLETSDVIFRGETRAKLPLATLTSITVRGEWLELVNASSTLSLKLGKDAEAWAKLIRSPKSVIEKLGVKSGQRALVIGLDDDKTLRADLETKGAVLENAKAKDLDVIFYEATSTKDLEKLASLKTHLAPAGSLWVIRKKGKEGLPEKEVFAAGKAAGLVDVKVVAYSETLTAEKFVIPVAARPASLANSIGQKSALDVAVPECVRALWSRADGADDIG